VSKVPSHLQRQTPRPCKVQVLVLVQCLINQFAAVDQRSAAWPAVSKVPSHLQRQTPRPCKVQVLVLVQCLINQFAAVDQRSLACGVKGAQPLTEANIMAMPGAGDIKHGVKHPRG